MPSASSSCQIVKRHLRVNQLTHHSCLRLWLGTFYLCVAVKISVCVCVCVRELVTVKNQLIHMRTIISLNELNVSTVSNQTDKRSLNASTGTQPWLGRWTQYMKRSTDRHTSKLHHIKPKTSSHYFVFWIQTDSPLASSMIRPKMILSGNSTFNSFVSSFSCYLIHKNLWIIYFD